MNCQTLCLVLTLCRTACQPRSHDSRRSDRRTQLDVAFNLESTKLWAVECLYLPHEACRPQESARWFGHAQSQKKQTSKQRRKAQKNASQSARLPARSFSGTNKKQPLKFQLLQCARHSVLQMSNHHHRNHGRPHNPTKLLGACGLRLADPNCKLQAFQRFGFRVPEGLREWGWVLQLASKERSPSPA